MVEFDIVVKNARVVTPMSGEPANGVSFSPLEVYDGVDIGVKDGIIVEIAPSLDGRGKEEISADARLVIPGFVDPHTHTVFGGQRAKEFVWRLTGIPYMEIRARGGGIMASVRATRAASFEELYECSLRRLQEMMGWGTTTVEIKSGYGLDGDAELKMLEVIAKLAEELSLDVVPTFLGAHDIPPEFGDDPDAYVEKVEQMIPEVANRGLARFCDVFCEHGVFTPEQSERVLRKGEEYGLLPKLHVDEFVPSGGAELAGKLSAVSADHLSAATDSGLEAMANAGVVAVLLPGTSFFLGLSSKPNLSLMKELGLKVALGTDFNPGSSTVLGMPLIITLACLHYGFTPEEALVASTYNSACALKMEEKVGTIEPGKQADILICDVENIDEIAYWVDHNPVRVVIKKGEVVKRECV